MSAPGAARGHWQAAHAARSDTEQSWHDEAAEPGLSLIARHGPGRQGAVIDIGAGASRLVDRLLSRGYRALTLLDISETALALTRDRLGPAAAGVEFIAADITDWTPPRRWDLWHDRAVMHFLTDAAGLAAYRRALLAGTGPGSVAVIGTFAPDGPARCSGLPVRRWSPGALADFLAPEFRPVAACRHLHRTPAGGEQAFQFSVLARL